MPVAGENTARVAPKPIGVFDSGLGGLSVLQALRAAMPEQSWLYLGDNLHAPYGERGQQEIFDLTLAAIETLWQAGCGLIILACNTASAVALRRIQAQCLRPDQRVLGVFVPMIEALIERPWGDNTPPSIAPVEQVALFATPATVASRAFQRELTFRAIGVDVEAQPCSGLVDAIEQGDQAQARVRVAQHVGALKLRMPTPQAAVLGCTHYPLLLSEFQRVLGPQVRVLSQADIVARSLKDYLQRHPEWACTGGNCSFLSTGDAVDVSRRASQLLGQSVVFSGL